MGVYKDEDKGTWRVIYRYTDYQGNRRQTQKRGFKTKREAIEWERQQMLKLEKTWIWSLDFCTSSMRSMPRAE